MWGVTISLVLKGEIPAEWRLAKAVWVFVVAVSFRKCMILLKFCGAISFNFVKIREHTNDL